MEFTFKDRIVLPNILPVKGSFEDLVVREDILKKITITQDELTRFEVRSKEDGSLVWKETGDVFPIEFSELERALIKRLLDKMNEEKTLPVDAINLFRLFK